MTQACPGWRTVLVTGLSGAGKASIMHVLEDLGFEAVDNPPFILLDTLVGRGRGNLAIGVDTRTDGFDPPALLEAIERQRARGQRIDLVFATADDAVLLRRFTATRRRHPLATSGRVIDGIDAERHMTASLRDAADLILDTTDMPAPSLRRQVEERLSIDPACRLSLTLVSFAFPSGLPPEADMVFDARFLKNPHYDPHLRERTGLDETVARYVRQDPDYRPFINSIEGLLRLVLPRFVREGKTYATVAIGCTGGRHRSVCLVDELARRMRATVMSDDKTIQIAVLHLGIGKATTPGGVSSPLATQAIGR